MPSNNATSFVPSLNGFHFDNSFTNAVLSADTLDAAFKAVGLAPPTFPAGFNLNPNVTTSGRCGGMAWLSLDYYLARLPVPTTISKASPYSLGIDDFAGKPNDDPPDGTPLADWIYMRLFQSWFASGTQTLAWIVGEDHNTWIFGGVPEMTTANEFPRLQRAIDDGTPVILALINWPNPSPSKCHQVVAYGYAVDDDGNMTVLIYDNRYSDDDDVVMTAAPNGHWTLTPSPDSGQPDQWKGWFVEAYSQGSIPFVDLVMASPIAVPPQVTSGDNINVTFSVNNAGPYPAHPVAFRILGSVADTQFFLGPVDGPKILAPGATVPVSLPFAQVAAVDDLGETQLAILQAQYQTLEGWWIPLVSTNGNANFSSITIGPDVSVWFTVGIPQLSVTIQAGALTGTATVSCSATVAGWRPGVTFAWFVDGNANPVATGASPTINIACGTAGALVLAHTITVVVNGTTAAEGINDSRSSTVQLTIRPLSVQCSVNYANSALVSQTSRVVQLGSVAFMNQKTNTYSVLEIDAVATSAFGSVKYGWAPPSVIASVPGTATLQGTPGPDSAPAPSVEVSVTAVDQLNQEASSSVNAQFSTLSGGVVPVRIEEPNLGLGRLPPPPGDAERELLADGQTGDLRGQLIDMRLNQGARVIGSPLAIVSAFRAPAPE